MNAYTAAILVFAVLALAAAWLGWNYLRLRGTRVVTCPDTQKKVAVDIDALAAATTAAVGSPRFHVHGCTHWPEKRDCGQTCLAEISDSPVDCLVRTQVSRWYVGKKCAVCQRPAVEVDWYERRPGLVSPDGHLALWHEVRAEDLDDILRSYKPVCFDCYVAETFRRTHPDLVVDNPHASPPPGRAN